MSVLEAGKTVKDVLRTESVKWVRLGVLRTRAGNLRVKMSYSREVIAFFFFLHCKSKQNYFNKTLCECSGKASCFVLTYSFCKLHFTQGLNAEYLGMIYIMRKKACSVLLVLYEWNKWSWFWRKSIKKKKNPQVTCLVRNSKIVLKTQCFYTSYYLFNY